MRLNRLKLTSTLLTVVSVTSIGCKSGKLPNYSQAFEVDAPLQDCLQSLKTEMSSLAFPQDDPKTNLDDPFRKYATQFNADQKGQKTFIVQRTKGKLDEISAGMYWESPQTKISLSYSVTSAFNLETKSDYLKYTISTEVFEQQKLNASMSLVYRIDSSQSCQKSLAEVDVIQTVQEQGRQVRLVNRKQDLLTNLSDNQEKTIDRTMLENNYKNNHPNSYKNHPAQLTTSLFVDFSLPNVQIVTTKLGSEVGMDRLLGKNMTLTKFSTAMVENGEKMLEQLVFANENSNYYRTEIPALDIATEILTQSEWSQVKLDSLREVVGGAKFYNFAPQDFANSSLSFEVSTKQPLTFSNYAAYFEMTSVQPRRIDATTNTYQVRFRAPVELKELNAPFVASPSTGSGSFLNSSKYIDFLNPSVAALAQSIKSKISATTTHKQVILMILRAVNQKIEYDYAALKQDAITTMKSSDALTKGKGVCQHFAALYVALSRAIGFPARPVAGFLLSYNEETKKHSGGPHAWVEAFVAGKWLPLEPQRDADLFLSYPGYFPTSVYAEYETQAGQEASIKELMKRYAEFDGYVFEKR